MCVEPTTALAIASVASAGIQYQTGKAQQKAQYQAQQRQNELAKKNAIQRYASEQLRIRQVVDETKEKGLEASKKARSVRASFINTAGESGIALSGSTEALMRDYYRTEGNYRASLNRNLDINISQYERNLEAIQFGQEAQSTYVQPPNPAMLFASAVGNVANTYYGIEMQKQNMGLMTNNQKKKYGSTTNTVPSQTYKDGYI